jgi:hypothetical protein
MNQNTAASRNSLIFGTGQRIFTAPAALAPIQPDEHVSMPLADIFHAALFGMSGHGKSRSLVSTATMLLHRGIGFTLLDPSGDTARLLLQTLISLGFYDHHPAPFERLLYLDLPAAFRQGYYPAFNILKTGFDAHSSADMVAEAFSRVFPSSESMTTIASLLKAGAYVLAVHQLPLFPFLYYLLTNVDYRTRLLDAIPDDLIRQFFLQNTSTRTGQLHLGAEATLKRLFLLMFTPALRYSLGQSDNPIFDYRSVIGKQQSIIINLNLPDLDAMRFWGALIVVSAEAGARARGEIDPAHRTGTHCILVDEYHNFVNQSATGFAHMLQEARKWGLFCFLCTQSPGATPESLRTALENIDILIAYRLARPGAAALLSRFGFPIDPFLVKEYGHTSIRYFSTAEQEDLYLQALTKLGKREAFIRLPGNTVYKMRALTVPDPIVPPRKLAEIEASYLQRYFRPQQQVEQAIASQLAILQPAQQEASVPEPVAGVTKPTTAEVLDDILRD